MLNVKTFQGGGGCCYLEFRQYKPKKKWSGRLVCRFIWEMPQHTEKCPKEEGDL